MEKGENGVDLAEGGRFDADSKEVAVKDGVRVKETRPEVPGGRSSKKPASVAPVQLKNGKSLKGEVRHNASAITVKKQKPETPISHSLSSKGKLASGARKSTVESKTIKTDIKTPESRVSKAVSEVINGSGEGSTTKPSNQAHDLDTHDIPAENFAVMNENSNGSSVETPHVSDNNPQSSIHSENPKCDEDAHSATSSTSPRVSSSQRRSSGSGFAFRLDERAEKRKEFLQKLEEKTQAQEAEKTDLLARSKENQEAEIKKLRKTLTFKATPMPTFYKEPGPPKAELKKIPLTRAVSPKLGRPRPLADVEGKASSKSMYSKHDKHDEVKSNGAAANVAVDSLAAKKTTKKPVSKFPTQKSTKHVPKSLEAKISDPEKKNVDFAEVQDHRQSPQSGESNGNTDGRVNAADNNIVEDNGAVLNLSNNMPTHEVAMGHVSVIG